MKLNKIRIMNDESQIKEENNTKNRLLSVISFLIGIILLIISIRLKDKIFIYSIINALAIAYISTG